MVSFSSKIWNLIMAKKRFILSILFTLLFTFALFPFYSMDNMERGIRKSRRNEISRIDIINSGAPSNRLEVIQHSPEIKLSYPEWFKKSNGQGMMIETTLKSQWKNFDITLKAIGDGLVNVALLGPDIKKDNKRFPVLVDYKKLSINGTEVLSKRKALWHDKQFNHSINVKNGDIIKVSFTARRHHFRISDLKRFYNFNWYIFSSIIILTFLFSRKLVNYVSMFKVEKKYSRIDIALVCFFFAVLFMPMLKIDNDEKSSQENRMLAKYIPLFNTQGINLQYGKQFESWFNDHFFGRNFLIKLNNEVHQHINKYYGNSKAQMQADGWLIGKNESQSKLISTKQLDEITNAIKQFNDFCEQNDIMCYIEIAPRKVEFMKDKLLRKVFGQDPADVLYHHLKNSNITNVIYPHDALIKSNKENFVFFKTDHHWTEWGAYIGYKELMTRIKLDFPSIYIVSEDDYDIFYDTRVRAEVGRNFWKGHTCMLLDLSTDNCPLDVKYKYYIHKNEAKLKTEWLQDGINNKIFSYAEAKNKQKVVILGNSFTENFVSFLAFTFSNVKKLRCNNKYGDNLKLSRWKKEILDFNPDIMLIVIQSEYLGHLKDLKD